MSIRTEKKRILPLLLALLMAAVLPASALAADTADTAVPYQEKIISLPDGYENATALAVRPDGAIIALAKTSQGNWNLLIWKDVAGTPEAIPLSLEGEPQSLDIAPDGQIMVTLSNLSDVMSSFMTQGDGNASAQPGQAVTNSSMASPQGGAGMNRVGGFNLTTTVVWLSEDGNETARYDVTGIASALKALSGRRVALSSMDGGVSILGDTGEEEATLSAYDVAAFAASDTSLFVLSADMIQEFDLATGALLREVPFNAGYSAKPALDPQGNLFILTTEGGFLLKADAGEAIKIMSMSGTLLGDPSNSASFVGMLADGAIVALIGSGGITSTFGGGVMVSARAIGVGGSGEGETTIAYYTPLDPQVVASRTPFTITALENSTRLRKAVSDFQRAHPELEVKLQVQMETGVEANLEDHIRTLNTDLLAGKGGDVLILDGLPMDQYIQRGILLDLSRYLADWDLLPNIAEGSAYEDGKVYGVPASYSFEVLWGRKEQIDRVSSLADLAYAADPDQTPFASRSAEEWLRLFYPSSEEAFRDSNGNLRFDTAEFEQFLDGLYELYQMQGELAQLDNFFGRAGGRGMGGMNVQEMLALYNGTVAFFPGEISGLFQLSTAYSLAGGEDSAAITLPSLSGEGRAYTPSCLAGINSRSAYTDLAAEFISLLLSPEVQETDQMGGLPTTKAALDKLFDEAIERSENSEMFGMVSIAGGVQLEMTQPDAATWEALRGLCEAVNVPAPIDETLMGFLVEETASFFDGRQTAKQAAQSFHQRAWFYLNE